MEIDSHHLNFDLLQLPSHISTSNPQPIPSLNRKLTNDLSPPSNPISINSSPLMDLTELSRSLPTFATDHLALHKDAVLTPGHPWYQTRSRALTSDIRLRQRNNTLNNRLNQAPEDSGFYSLLSRSFDITSNSELASSPSLVSLAERENKKVSLYKTELCRSYEETGFCRYGSKCQFAHSRSELRNVSRHPKYKTEICKTFWEQGTCPYGKRCCFIHTERISRSVMGNEALSFSAPGIDLKQANENNSFVPITPKSLSPSSALSDKSQSKLYERQESMAQNQCNREQAFRSRSSSLFSDDFTFLEETSCNVPLNNGTLEDGKVMYKDDFPTSGGLAMSDPKLIADAYFAGRLDPNRKLRNQGNDALCGDWENVCGRYGGSERLWNSDLVNEVVNGPANIAYQAPLMTRQRTHTHQGPLETSFEHNSEPFLVTSDLSGSASKTGIHPYFNRGRRTLSMIQTSHNPLFFNNQHTTLGPVPDNSNAEAAHQVCRHRSESFTCGNSFINNLAIQQPYSYPTPSSLPSSNNLSAVPTAFPRSIMKDPCTKSHPLPISKPVLSSTNSSIASSSSPDGFGSPSTGSLSDDSKQHSEDDPNNPGKRLPVFRNII